jgi:hypothetical protein
MVAASCISRLWPALAGCSGSRLGAAARGVTGASGLAQLHTLVVQVAPFGEKLLLLLGALGGDLHAPVGYAMEPCSLGRLLDLLERGRGLDAAADVVSGHETAAALG